MKEKLKVEIWSDVMCPFCYIGKRKFELTLENFPQKENVEIEWKSFQLSPDMVTDPGKNIHQFLAQHKGISVTEAKQMNDYVTNLAAQVGLKYDFDKAVPANSRKAHQFSHFARQFGKQNEAEELLFKSYFTEGRNTDDVAVLVELAELLDLDGKELVKALENESFDGEVGRDILEAQQIGVRGVPFFVFDRKYAVSGAQDPSVFLETLQKSFENWKPSSIEIQDGQSCDVNGECD